MKGIVAAALWAGFATIVAAQTFTVPLKRHFDETPMSFTRRSLLNKRQTTVATEKLYNLKQSLYLMEIDVGTPPKKFNVLVDTGSPSLWLPNPACTTSCPTGLFDPSASSTFKSLGVPYGIQYGTGSVAGTYGTDTVSIAGLTVTEQIFGVANETEGTIVIQNGTTQEMIGIIGLGYPSLSFFGGYSGDVNFVFNLVNRSIIADPIFSVFLDSQYQTGYSGEITFGGIDMTKFDGNLQYAPVVPFTMKESNSQAYLYWAVGGIGAKTSTGYSATFTSVAGFILDTGTLFTYLPGTLAQDMVDSFLGHSVPLNTTYGVYIVPCSLASSKQTISLLVLSSLSNATAAPIELVIGMNELILPLNEDTISDNSTCAFAILPMSDQFGTIANSFIIGETILRSFYTVFDMGQNRVGFAQAKLSTTSATASASSPSAAAPTPSDSINSAAVANKPTAAAAMVAVAMVTLCLFVLPLQVVSLF